MSNPDPGELPVAGHFSEDRQRSRVVTTHTMRGRSTTTRIAAPTQRMVIASGVEAYPNLAQMAYQAVRLLRGDIRPEQFLTGPGEEDGFFDALANGPVSATDPRALEGDLIAAAAGSEP